MADGFNIQITLDIVDNLTKGVNTALSGLSGLAVAARTTAQAGKVAAEVSKAQSKVLGEKTKATNDQTKSTQDNTKATDDQTKSQNKQKKSSEQQEQQNKKTGRSFSDLIKTYQSGVEKALALSRDLSLVGAATQALGGKILSSFSAPIQGMREIEKAKGILQSLDMTNLKVIEDVGRETSKTIAGVTTAAFMTAAYDIKSGISSLTEEGVAAQTRAAAITAKATRGDIGQMTGLFASAYASHKSQFKDMSDAAFGDMFGGMVAQSVQTFQMDATKMQEYLQALGASATTVGMKLSDQMAIGGLLGGANGFAVMGTATRSLAANAAKADKELKKYGVRIVDTKGQMRDMADIIADLEKSKLVNADGSISAKNMAKLGEAAGSAEAAKVLIGLIGKSEELRKASAEVGKAQTTGLTKAIEMAKQMDNNLDSRLTIFDQRIGEFKNSIGQSLIPTIDNLLLVLDPVLTWIEEFAAANPGTVSTIATTAAVIGGLITVIGGLISVAGALLAPLLFAKFVLGGLGITSAAAAAKIKILSMGLRFATIAMRGFSIALMANPIGLVIAAVLALAAAVYVIYDSWDSIVAWFTGKLDAVKSAFGDGFLPGLMTLFMEFNPFTIFLEAANGLINYIFGVDIKGWLMEQVSGLADAMPDWMKDLLGIDTTVAINATAAAEAAKSSATAEQVAAGITALPPAPVVPAAATVGDIVTGVNRPSAVGAPTSSAIGGGLTVNFNPQISLTGVDPNQVRDALRSMENELMAMIARAQDRAARRAF